jgi:predicted acyltransferase
MFMVACDVSAPHLRTIKRNIMSSTEAIATQAPSVPAKAGRLESIDQFRGYTVAGMFLVNFVSGYDSMPAFFRHHNTYCSYADTIMPQFFLAVGLTYRLTFMRRLASDDPSSAWQHALSRNLGLLLVGFVVHGLDGGVSSWAELQARGWHAFLPTAFERNFFQTLTLIAITSIWVLPVIGKSSAARIWWMLFSIGLWVFFAIVPAPWSGGTYVNFALSRPVIDGGPLGFLTWTVPLLAGSLACDWLNLARGASNRRMVGSAVLLMIAGYAISCIGQKTWPALPFVPPPTDPTATSPAEMFSRAMSTGTEFKEEQSEFLKTGVAAWTMSQRVGGPSYLVFSAGFGLAVFQLFRWLCDGLNITVGAFRTLGINALAGYVIHPMVASKIKPFVPRDCPLSFLLIAFAWYFLITWVILRHLEKTKTIIRL